ncbi:MAG: type I DNA topoisomerase [Firmicutes bacterium]|nr:type I DNA topoisomerase [Bacillota bacterium]
MAKTLVIVESPSKAKTIGKYLGSTYKVEASVGHIRDLPKSKLGINIEKDFEPEYIPIRGKGDLIKQLRKEAEEASKVFLATDPDREGEAISWHLCYLLGLDPKDPVRVTFNEITKDTVKAAIKNPRAIDLNLVDAQQARRVLDRLVGYEISPILWRKVRKGLSAGRVQSATLKIICDREREIEAFVPKEYWNITVDFENKKPFSAKVTDYKGEKLVLSSKEETDKAVNDLEQGKYIVSSVNKKERVAKAFAPFTTSSLQQDASNKLGFTTKKTMSVAQRLYEGINVPGKGTMGLITYMRTDSVRISDEARKACYGYIMENFGKEYTAYNVFQNKKKDIQDAHEAIRPANVFILPEEIKDVDKDLYRLYKLIWERFVGSQMAPARFDTTQVNIENGDYTLRAYGSKRTFLGYQKVYASSRDEDKDKILPELKEGDELTAEAVNTEQKFTEPPQRFTEASLVKEMEDKNIGRPSTYAPTISNLMDKEYVERPARTKVLKPTELGFTVTSLMENHFKDIVDLNFTSEMEDRLDEVEADNTDWKQILRDFYGPFKKELDEASNMERIKQKDVQATGDNGEEILCEKCGKPMLIKTGRFGQFMACSGFPECRNTKPIVKATGVKCPECGGDIIARRGKSGKVFYGCSNYPKCNTSFWDKPVNKKCPECGNLLVEKHKKNTKYACSNVKCNYTE